MRALCILLLAAGIARGGESVLLEFSQTGCRACAHMQPVIKQLEQEGIAVRHIDAARETHLVRRYQVTSVPTYIVLSGSKEVSRLSGAQPIQTLRQALASSQAARIRATGARTQGAAVPQTPMSMVPAGTMAPGGGVLSQSQNARQSQAPSSEAMPSISLAAAVERAQAATVRIRVREHGAVGVATGTIIDNHGAEALVLTCGHVFRDSQGKAPIEVELFYQGRIIKVPGQLIDYDADTKDIGLVSIKPGFQVAAVPIVPANDLPQSGTPAFSFGCDQGADPSRRDTRVTAVNKYNQHIGASNLEIAGAPTIGRSGGGLFDHQGRLIGVCNAADFEDNIGIYAGPGTVHWQLDRVALQNLYQSPSPQQVPETRLASTRGNFANAGTQSANPASAMNNAEVTIIVRDRNRPGAPPQVKTFDHAPAEVINLMR